MVRIVGIFLDVEVLDGLTLTFFVDRRMVLTCSDWSFLLLLIDCW